MLKRYTNVKHLVNLCMPSKASWKIDPVTVNISLSLYTKYRAKTNKQ